MTKQYFKSNHLIGVKHLIMAVPEKGFKPYFITPKPIQKEYPLFIYLPGMDGTGRLLRVQIAALENSFDIRCLAIPLTDQSDWGKLTSDLVDLVKAELQLQPRRSVYLCGESFGGCLAMKILVEAPHLFSRIILVNPASSFHRLPWLNWASQMLDLVPSAVYTFGAVGFLPFLVSLTRIAAADRQDILKIIRSVPSQTVNWRVSLLRNFSVDMERLSQIQQQILLIGSASDRLLPSVTEIEFLADIFPNSQVFILPDSGHACLLEKDIDLYEIIKAYDEDL